MTEGQLKFVLLVVAGFLGIFFRLGIVGWWGLGSGIAIAILGPIAVTVHCARANRKRKERALQIYAAALLKQAEGSPEADPYPATNPPAHPRT